MKRWYKKLVMPFGPCEDAGIIADKFKTAKGAYANWPSENIDNLLWFIDSIKHGDMLPIRAKLIYRFAEAVLPLFEKEYPNDKRPRMAIEAAKAYANDPTEAKRQSWAAARDAAGNAARAAARAAALAAARDAALDAARDAAWAAAWGAARDAQKKIIFETLPYEKFEKIVLEEINRMKGEKP